MTRACRPTPLSSSSPPPPATGMQLCYFKYRYRLPTQSLPPFVMISAVLVVGIVAHQCNQCTTNWRPALPPFSIKLSVRRPKPLFQCTASQLGIHKTRGVPSLLDALLPASAPLIVHRWLRHLLLLPPPPPVAAAICAACHLLAGAPAPTTQQLLNGSRNCGVKLRPARRLPNLRVKHSNRSPSWKKALRPALQYFC